MIGHGAKRKPNLVNFGKNLGSPNVTASGGCWPANFEICRVGFVNCGLRCWGCARKEVKTRVDPASSRKAGEKRGRQAKDELVDYSKFLFENEILCFDLDSRRE